jgi:hypothetical protein
MSKELYPDYHKKVVNSGPGCPLSETFTSTQIAKRISFYPELNEKRKHIIRNSELVEKRFALYGWEDTTTVRVYMRETVSRIAAELFYSDYLLSVANVYSKSRDGTVDRNHGHVVVTLRATQPEIDTLMEYLREGASYFVYDGERSKYVAGNTEASEFIIVKPDETVQPKTFWRRSQSYIMRVEELGGGGDGPDGSDNRID